MKKTLSLFLLLFTSLAAANAQEEVLWEGTPVTNFDGRYSPNNALFKDANLQEGDILRIYLTNITETQKVWLKIDGVSVNSPDVMEVGTLYFDHVLTADNITKIENEAGGNSNYKQGGLYVKIQDGKTGQIYKITVRRNGTASNRFGLYLGEPVQDNIAFTSGNNLLTIQASEPALNDTIVMQFTGATAGDKMWLQDYSMTASYGFPDVLPVDDKGAGEWRAVLTQAAATDFATTGAFFHRSSVDYSIGTIYLHKYIKPEEEVLPPSREIILWQGSESAGSADLRFGAIRTVVDEANISGKDTIKVYVIGADADDQVILKEAKTWDGKYTSLTAGQNVVEYPINAVYATKIQEESFIVQRSEGNDYTMRYVTVAKYIPIPIPQFEVLVDENTYIQWDGSICTIPASKLANLTVGDILHINIDKYYTKASTKDNKIEADTPADSRIGVHRNSGTYHDNIYGGASNDITSKNYTVEFTEEVYNKMVKDNGDFYDLIVTGYWYSFTSVVLEHRFKSVQLNADGLATFSHSEIVDCSQFESLGLKAYTASISGDRIVTTKVTEAVPAGTGLILQGEPNAVYNLPFAASADAVVGNVLQPTTGENVTGYVFAKHSTKGIGFFKVTNQEVPAGKAYIADFGSAARYFTIDFLDDEPTSIKNAPITKHTAVQEAYNFMGQRVAANSKGLVIINGKKVFNK